MRFRRCGIAIKLKKFGLDLRMKPDARTKKDMKEFIFDPVYLTKIKDPLYLMYRDVGALNPAFRKLGRKYRVRYDITVMRSGLMGPEYIRTAGHYHPQDYSEIYEVIHGKAAFILQSRDLKRMKLVLAEKGDVIIIPPHYGHQSVNIGRTVLVTGNLSGSGFKSDYSVYKKKRGGAFYLSRAPGGALVMANLNYGIMPSRFPRIKKTRARKGLPLDRMFERNPKKIADFLDGKKLL